MTRPKINEPVTNNKEKAQEQNRREESDSAGPSRAAERHSGRGESEKKPTKAPKQ